MRQPVPLSDLGRPQEMGRIRMGVKTDRGTKAIDTWRFTSPDKTAIDQVAGVFGGEVKPWKDAKARHKGQQWEVITRTAELPVWIQPGSLTQWHELWSGGRCLRRCDGRICQVPVADADPPEWTERGCVCAEQGFMDCKTTTRLGVMLPAARLGGVWRVETKSEIAAHELRQMDQLLQHIQAAGIVKAKLIIWSDSTQQGRYQFKYPRLILDSTPEELEAGEANVKRLTRADVEPEYAALSAADETLDDEVVDAEIVEEEPVIETRMGAATRKALAGEGESWATVADAVRAGLTRDEIVKEDGRWIRK